LEVELYRARSFSTPPPVSAFRHAFQAITLLSPIQNIKSMGYAQHKAN
jgi:hypothetical protein